MTVKLKPQVHIEPHQEVNGFGTLSEWIEMHTYNPDDITALALLCVHGSNMDNFGVTVELWLTAEQIVAIRDGLNQLIEESDDTTS